MNHLIYLGLGSNLGDRPANLRAAITAMAENINIRRESPIYETAPWGFEDQADFLNQVIEGQTNLSPQELLEYVKQLELEIGRTPTFRNGPREIDIDILFYDELVLTTDKLTIPHPRLAERTFILVPLADLAMDLVHPVEKQSIEHLLTKQNRTGVKQYEEIEH